MARIELAPGVRDDLDRILDHLTEFGTENMSARVGEIIQAISVLEHNPLIGRPVDNGKRELVIGRRAHGYVALYRFVPEVDVIFVLAIKGQREAGYTRE